MSSASVFNANVLAELRHRTPRVSTECVVNNNSSFTRDLSTISSVRRNIFGPVDHEACRKFVQKELEVLEKQSSDYWGFDFVTEVPISNARFKWEPIPEKPLCRPRKRPVQIEYDISHLYPEPLDDVRPVEENVDSNRDKQEESEDLAKIAKVRARGQSLITDFLKSTKSSQHRFQQIKKKKKKPLINVTPSPNRTDRVIRSLRS